MKKTFVYMLIASIAVFTACKKSPVVVKVEPTVSDPYQHARPTEIVGDDGTMNKYSYNTANQVAKVEYFTSPGVLYSTQKFNYLGGKLIQVVLENTTTTKYVTEYKYQGSTAILESTISTATDYQNPALPVVTSKSSQEYSYLDGKIFKTTFKDGQDKILSIRTTSFSLKGENPFVTADNVPQAAFTFPSTITTEYYKDVIAPTSYFLGNSTYESKFIAKSGTSSLNGSSYNRTYELDVTGKLKTLTTLSTVNGTTSTAKTTYTYESY